MRGFDIVKNRHVSEQETLTVKNTYSLSFAKTSSITFTT